jgi:hypothetical protein
MDESRVLARLDRIDELDRRGAAPAELLAELRGLLRDAETLVQGGGEATNETKEVVGRLRTALARDIIGR